MIPDRASCGDVVVRRWEVEDGDALRDAIVAAADHLAPRMLWVGEWSAEDCDPAGTVRRWNRAWEEGGDLVAANVRAAQERRRGKLAGQAVKIVEVQATKGKRIRAEPVAALHERGLIHLVGGLPELAREVTEWNPRIGGVSPNRLDALVWGVWHLARLGEEEQRPDYAGSLRAASAVGARLRAPERAAAGQPASLAAMLPRAAWGSRL